MTGARGTVGAAVVRAFPPAGYSVEPWDRGRVPIDDYAAMEAFVQSVSPDVLVHLAVASQPTGRENESWVVNYEWPSELAWICRQLGVRFVFASSALVFSNQAQGPFTVASTPDAAEGYGMEKRKAEARVMEQFPRAVIARLGWQIESAPVGNTMLRNLRDEAERDGKIRASQKWIPACAYLNDTADAIVRLATSPEPEPGVYQLDANAEDAWSYFDIASALARPQGWTVEPTEDFVYDQRMIDRRIRLPSIADRIGVEVSR